MSMAVTGFSSSALTRGAIVVSSATTATARARDCRMVGGMGVLPTVQIGRAPDGTERGPGLGALVRACPLPQLLFYLGEIEGARRLTGRVLLHRLEEFRGHGLHRHDHEHPRKEPVVVGIRVVLGTLARIMA